MTTRSGDPWDLTAPESLVLRDGTRAERALAIKLGLLELVTRGSLRLVDTARRNWLGRERVEKVLAAGHRPLPDTGVLAPIATAFYNAPAKALPDGTAGRSIPALAQSFARDRRTRGRGYVHDVILPALAGRGLYARKPDRLLGIVPRTRWTLTSEGERRRADLLMLLSDGDAMLARKSDDDRWTPAEFLATAGPAALPMTEAYPELAAISQRLRRGNDPGDGGTVWVASSSGAGDADDDGPPSPDPSPEPSPTGDASAWSADAEALDFGSLSVGGFEFTALDGIDAAFDAIDSGVDAGGGGDGGGDGGNGGGD